jgi:hypothetical protein
MRFETPAGLVTFEIPDDWWSFAEMDNFSTKGGRFYAYPPDAQDVDVVAISDVEPPMRNSGVPPLKKHKMVPILFGLSSPECALPPVEVQALAAPAAHRFKVHNGYHRYYASVAVGYPLLPIVIRPS